MASTACDCASSSLGGVEDSQVVEILDLLHVCSYIWKAARAFHSSRSGQEEFAIDKLTALLEGRVQSVIRSLRYLSTSRGLCGEKQKDVATACGYFESHQNRMRYDEYLAAGYPIATGVIEGACRHIVKDRMERTGMKWTLEGAQSILNYAASKHQACGINSTNNTIKQEHTHYSMHRPEHRSHPRSFRVMEAAVPKVIKEWSGRPLVEYSIDEGVNASRIADKWIATFVSSDRNMRAGLLDGRLNLTRGEPLFDQLQWFADFSRPASVWVWEEFAWLQCLAASPVAGGLHSMFITGTGAWPLPESLLMCFEPAARSALEGFTNHLGGWMEGGGGGLAWGGFFSMDPPNALELGFHKAAGGGVRFARLPEYMDVWENTTEWSPAVIVYIDQGSGLVLVRRDGACGWAVPGEDRIELAFPSLAGFLECYTRYWATGGTGPLQYWDLC